MSGCMVYDDLVLFLQSEGNVHGWLRERGLLGSYGGVCESCGVGLCVRIVARGMGVFGGVQVKKCNRKLSIRKGSWFEGSHLSIDVILKLTYYWVYNCCNEFVMNELRIGSKHTIVDWFNFAREVCIEILVRENVQVGGPGKRVEIDESKFGKRKYHRGRRVDGQWVFGGIERESKNSFFACVDDRSAATLIPLILRWVKPGTTIISDCWKAYGSLGEHNYTHLTVNHSLYFVDPSTGAHTNIQLSQRGGPLKLLYRSLARKSICILLISLSMHYGSAF